MRNRWCAMTGAIACGMLALTASCTSEKEALLKQGYPEAYAQGFDDGCHSGKKAGGNMFEGLKKDVQRFENDSKYAQGWQDGFNQCEKQQEALDRQMQMSLERQRLNEEKKHKMEQDALKGINTKGLENLK